MRIWFKTKKLERTFGSETELRKAFGVEQARKIQVRMLVLRSVARLADVPTIPPDRCHQLKGDRIGQFAVDVLQPHRLIFSPKSSVIKGKGGKIDPSEVSEIVILGVEDYHGD
jgi:plasmid maintenance system killer protein